MQKNLLKYSGKNISVLGDSVSSLEGYNPEGYPAFFSADNCEQYNIYKPADTWWGEVIEKLDAKLLKNDSWSGSLVSAQITQAQVFPSSSSDERTSHLHKNDEKPDLILIYMGINDYILGTAVDGVLRQVERYNYRYFSFAYNKMLEKLKINYPNSEIFCITLNPTRVKDNESFSFPLEYLNNSLESFNNAIKKSASRNNCRVIDTFKYNETIETLDTAHPTREGMHTLAQLILKELEE